MLYIALAALAIIGDGSFIQCEPEDSLESLDDLADDYSEKLGVTCESWPFYSGGFPKHPSSDSSDSSDDDDSAFSLLPTTITSGDFLYGFDDEVQNTQCMESSTTGYCLKWVITKQEYVESSKGGCHGHHDSSAADVITSYQVCACANDNYGASTVDVGTYCATWACLETEAYPADYDSYSLVMDNAFLISSSDSSDDDDEANGDYYRFAKDGSTLELDESMEFVNCWCKSASLNGKYCLNWYCESLEHDEYGCHKKGFGVDDYGWFGCIENAESENVTACQQSYGFLVDEEVRDEYRCQVGDSEGVTVMCGVRELPLRQNYVWYNFPLAMFLWVCLCGCCGTRSCYKNKRCNGEPKKWPKWMKCRKCRLFSFYVVFGTVSLFHGGFPAFLFFNLFSLCTCWCSYKCENCKCCRSKCSWSKKWECNTTCSQKKSVEQAIMNTAQNTTDKDGENSKEESAEHEMVEVSSKGANKTGHVRLNSVDVDEVDGDQPSV